MNRKDKIKILTGILEGKKSTKELQTPKHFDIHDEVKDLFIDKKTGKIYTHDEVKRYVKNSPYCYVILSIVTRNKETDEFESRIEHYFSNMKLKSEVSDE